MHKFEKYHKTRCLISIFPSLCSEGSSEFELDRPTIPSTQWKSHELLERADSLAVTNPFCWWLCPKRPRSNLRATVTDEHCVSDCTNHNCKPSSRQIQIPWLSQPPSFFGFHYDHTHFTTFLLFIVLSTCIFLRPVWHLHLHCHISRLFCITPCLFSTLYVSSCHNKCWLWYKSRSRSITVIFYRLLSCWLLLWFAWSDFRVRDCGILCFDFYYDLFASIILAHECGCTVNEGQITFKTNWCPPLMSMKTLPASIPTSVTSSLLLPPPPSPPPLSTLVRGVGILYSVFDSTDVGRTTWLDTNPTELTLPLLKFDWLLSWPEFEFGVEVDEFAPKNVRSRKFGSSRSRPTLSLYPFNGRRDPWGPFFMFVARDQILVHI